jgi:hypothetical protein
MGSPPWTKQALGPGTCGAEPKQGWRGGRTSSGAGVAPGLVDERIARVDPNGGDRRDDPVWLAAR